MINSTLLFSTLFGLACFYVFIGIWTSRNVKTLKDYFLADRNLGIFKLTFTLVATQLGSGLLLGTSQRAYHLGLLGIMYTVGMSLGFIILGCGLASRMRSLNIATTAEIFETHYKSTKLKLFASALSIISLWGILVAQIIASKVLFTSLGFDNPYLLTAFWACLICYTMIGGFSSVVIIDAIQVVLILTIFTTLFIQALPIASAKLTTLSLLPQTQADHFSHNISLSSLVPTLLMPTLFSLIEQDLAQRFFAAKTKTTATASAFLASIMLIVFSCIPIFFGMFAKVEALALPTSAEPLIPAIATFAGPTFIIFAICGIIAAITSTADSLLSAISSNIVQDFSAFLPVDRQKLLMSRLVSFATGCLALIASFFITGDIISVLENSYRISVICLLIPTLIAYFYKNLYKQAAYASIICGLSGLILAKLFVTAPILKDVIPLALSLIGYSMMHYVQRHK